MINPKQYQNSKINNYHQLFSGKYYKLRVYDQLFNVVGNGIRDIHELQDHLDITNHINYDFVPEKYISGEDLYYMIYDEGMNHNCMYNVKSLYAYFTLREVNSLPKKFRARLINNNYSVYPNFRKEYSIIWCDGVVDFLTDEWKRECKWFYEQCRPIIVNGSPNIYDKPKALTFIDETVNMLTDNIKGLK